MCDNSTSDLSASAKIQSREDDCEIEENDCGKMASLINSKRGRELDEDDKCSPDDIINGESKKLKKNLLHWNWTDEYTLLKNFYEFAGKNGSYSKDFYHFVKKKLGFEVSNSQLSDKVYRLKKRYLKEKSKMELEPEISMKFSNGNHEKLFEMSNNIWGSDQQNLNLNVQWNPEGVDGWYERKFKSLLETCKLDIACIPPNVLQDIRKDYEDMKMAQNEYDLNYVNFLVEISDIRCAQNI